jgi:hypothetical protein
MNVVARFAVAILQDFLQNACSVRRPTYSGEHMFQLTPERLQRLLSLVDDVLAGDPPEEAAQHPHRQPLRWHHTRRAGTVSARPAHCLSPVRMSNRQRMRDGATR